MLLYGERKRKRIKDEENQRFSYVPDTFFTFAAGHLVTTMYPIDGGTAFRILKRQGLKHLGRPIRAVLDTPLGTITFGKYVLGVRNQQMTHGEFDHSSLPPGLRNIGSRRRKREKYDDLFEELLTISRFVGRGLEDILPARPVQRHGRVQG